VVRETNRQDAKSAKNRISGDRRVWLIGGTSESALLASAMVAAQLPCTISVTTEAARGLYPPAPVLRVWVGRLDAGQIRQFLQEQGIVAILDASHPYAVEISKLAVAAARECDIPYLRYERPPVSSDWPSQIPKSPNPGTHYPPSQILTEVDSFETLLVGECLAGERVLLVVGYRPLPLFRAWQERCTLFARILPSLPALQAALDAGFTPDRLVALRPPVSAELERALWKQWQISLVVAKASGTAGGEDVKRAVAAELGVPVVLIKRPAVEYPQQTSQVAVALEFCRRLLSGEAQ